MSPKEKINLLPKDTFEFSNTGRLVQWLVSVGRWVVVLTEFVVICAFLSRFYFDTKLANLFDEIKQKKAIVQSAFSFEENFRETQKKLKLIKSILPGEPKASVLASEISQYLPANVFLTSINLNQDSLLINGSALSEDGLQIFLNGLMANPKFGQFSLQNIFSQKDDPSAINFSISAQIKP